MRNRLELVVRGGVFLLLFLFCWLALFTGTFPLTKLTPLWGRMGYFDWPVFIDAATHFINTGFLYYPELERYAPNASIYKFPPLFASILVMALRVGVEPETLRLVIGTLQLLLYFASLGLCIYVSRVRPSFFLGVGLFLFVATFEPFINNFIGLQLEIFILFLACLMLWSLARQKYRVAGFLLGLAIALKLYPVFLVVIGLCSAQRIKFLQGLVVGLAATLVFSTLVIGVDQSWLYFTRIAPALATEVLATDLRNVSISNLLVQLGVSPHYATYAGSGLLLATIIFLCRRQRLSSHPTWMMAGLSLLVSALVLGIKNSWGNYQLLLALPVMILLAEAIKNEKKDYLSLVLISVACGLIFFSPPHRLYFMAELLFGLQEIPVVPLFVVMRSISSLVIFLLCLGLFRQVAISPGKG